MNALDFYLKKIQAEQVSTSVSAGINPPESVAGMKPIRSPKGKPVVTEQELERDKRIMVDFDGTIHKYSKGWFNGQVYDVPVEGAKESLSFLKNEGFEVVIYTTRVAPEMHPEGYQANEQAIRTWMDKYSVPFDRITAQKLLALVYIDDNGLRFSNWKDTLLFLKGLKFF